MGPYGVNPFAGAQFGASTIQGLIERPKDRSSAAVRQDSTAGGEGSPSFGLGGNSKGHSLTVSG